MKKKSIKGWVARQLLAKAVRWSSLQPYQRQLLAFQMQGRQLRVTSTPDFSGTSIFPIYPVTVFTVPTGLGKTAAAVTL